jgi:hypothetical protein
LPRCPFEKEEKKKRKKEKEKKKKPPATQADLPLYKSCGMSKGKQEELVATLVS